MVANLGKIANPKRPLPPQTTGTVSTARSLDFSPPPEFMVQNASFADKIDALRAWQVRPKTPADWD
jgi:hypothetical protein